MREWLVAADDRTGAFEVAALFAGVVGPVTVTVGDAPVGSGVVDIGTRAMASDGAARVAAAVDEWSAAWLGHKIDSTLRGNWVAELRARHRATGRPVVVLPGWPEMGRTCVDGVVFVDGVAIGSAVEQLGDADHVGEVAELRMWLEGSGSFVVCDIPNSAAMHAAASVLVGRDVLLAGPAGPLGATFAAHRAESAVVNLVSVSNPVLVVCGSANPVSRQQVQRLSLARPEVEVIATDAPDGELHHAAVMAIAAHARRRIESLRPQTIVIIGGDTAAEVLGSQPRLVRGFATAGMPFSLDSDGRGPRVITKAGGFGGPDTLVELLRGENG